MHSASLQFFLPSSLRIVEIQSNYKKVFPSVSGFSFSSSFKPAGNAAKSLNWPSNSQQTNVNLSHESDYASPFYRHLKNTQLTTPKKSYFVYFMHNLF